MRSTCGWREGVLTSRSSATRMTLFVIARAPRRRRCLWSALADRFAACKLVLHPEKTKIVYCKDANRRGDFPIISFDFLGFQFRARKTMWREGTKRIFAHSFQPAASPKALTFISRTIRRWTLHHSSDKSLPNLAETYNPCIRGWINYYSQLLPNAVAFDPEEDRPLCHPLGAPQIQTAASQNQRSTRLV